MQAKFQQPTNHLKSCNTKPQQQLHLQALRAPFHMIGVLQNPWMQRTSQLHQAVQRRFRQQEQKAKLLLKTPKPEAGKQRFQPESEIQGAVARPRPF